MTIRFTGHARVVIDARMLRHEWIAQTLANPEWTSRDPTDPTLVRAYRTITDAGSRILRVVYRRNGHDMIVVTAFLDRGAAR